MSKITRPDMTLTGARVSTFKRNIAFGNNKEFEESFSEIVEIINNQLEKLKELPNIRDDLGKRLEKIVEDFKTALSSLIDTKTKIETDIRSTLQGFIDEEIRNFKNKCLIKIAEETDLEELKRMFLIKMKILLLEYMEYSEEEDKIEEILTTERGSLFLLYQSGSLYVTGANEYGILGIGRDGHTDQLEFIKVDRDINGKELGRISNIRIANPKIYLNDNIYDTDVYRVELTSPNGVYYSGVLDFKFTRDNILGSSEEVLEKSGVIIYSNSNFTVNKKQPIIHFDSAEDIINKSKISDVNIKKNMIDSNKNPKYQLTGINPFYIYRSTDNVHLVMNKEYKILTFCLYESNIRMDHIVFKINGAHFNFYPKYSIKTEEKQMIQQMGISNFTITRVNRNWIMFFIEFVEKKADRNFSIEANDNLYLDNIGYICEDLLLEETKDSVVKYNSELPSEMVVPRSDITGDVSDTDISLDNINAVSLSTDFESVKENHITNWKKDKELGGWSPVNEKNNNVIAGPGDFKTSRNKHYIRYAHFNGDVFYLNHNNKYRDNCIMQVFFTRVFKKMSFNIYTRFFNDKLALFIDGKLYKIFKNKQENIWDTKYINLKEYKEHTVCFLLFTNKSDNTNHQVYIKTINLYNHTQILEFDINYDKTPKEIRSMCQLDLTEFNESSSSDYNYSQYHDKDSHEYVERFRIQSYTFTPPTNLDDLPQNVYLYILFEQLENFSAAAHILKNSTDNNNNNNMRVVVNGYDVYNPDSTNWKVARGAVKLDTANIYKATLTKTDLKGGLLTIITQNMDIGLQIKKLLLTTIDVGNNNYKFFNLNSFNSKDEFVNLSNGVDFKTARKLLPDNLVTAKDLTLFEQPGNGFKNPVHLGIHETISNDSVIIDENKNLYFDESYIDKNDKIDLPHARIDAVDKDVAKNHNIRNGLAICTASLKYGEGNYKSFIINNTENFDQEFRVVIKRFGGATFTYFYYDDPYDIGKLLNHNTNYSHYHNDENTINIRLNKNRIICFILFIPFIDKEKIDKNEPPFVSLSFFSMNNSINYNLKHLFYTKQYKNWLLFINKPFNNTFNRISKGTNNKCISFDLNSIISFDAYYFTTLSFELYDKTDKNNKDVECEVYMNNTLIKKCTYGYNFIICPPGTIKSDKSYEETTDQYLLFINTSYKPLSVEDIRIDDFINKKCIEKNSSFRFMLGHQFYIPTKRNDKTISHDNALIRSFFEKNNIFHDDLLNSENSNDTCKSYAKYIWKHQMVANGTIDDSDEYSSHILFTYNGLFDLSKIENEKRNSHMYTSNTGAPVRFGILKMNCYSAAHSSLNFDYFIKNTITIENGKKIINHSKIFVYISGMLIDTLELNNDFTGSNATEISETKKYNKNIFTIIEHDDDTASTDIVLLMVSYGHGDTIAKITSEIKGSNPVKYSNVSRLMSGGFDNSDERFIELSNKPPAYDGPFKIFGIKHKGNTDYYVEYYMKNISGKAGIFTFLDDKYVSNPPIVYHTDDEPFKKGDWTRVYYKDAKVGKTLKHQMVLIIPYEELIWTGDYRNIKKTIYTAHVDGGNKIPSYFSHAIGAHSFINPTCISGKDKPFKEIVFTDKKIRNICFFINKDFNSTEYTYTKIFKDSNLDPQTVQIKYGYNTIDNIQELSNITFNKKIAMDNIFFNYDDMYKMELTKKCHSIEFDYYCPEEAFNNFKFYIDGKEEIIKVGKNKYYKSFGAEEKDHTFLWTLQTDLLKVFRLSYNFAIVENILINPTPSEVKLIGGPENKFEFKNSLKFDYFLDYYRENLNLYRVPEFTIRIDDEQLVPILTSDLLPISDSNGKISFNYFSNYLCTYFDDLNLQKNFKDKDLLKIHQEMERYKINKHKIYSDFDFIPMREDTFELRYQRKYSVFYPYTRTLWISSYTMREIVYNNIGIWDKEPYLIFEKKCKMLSFNILLMVDDLKRYDLLTERAFPRFFIKENKDYDDYYDSDDKYFEEIELSKYITRTQHVGERMIIFRFNYPVKESPYSMKFKIQERFTHFDYPEKVTDDHMQVRYLIYDIYGCDKRKIVTADDIDIQRQFHTYKEDFSNEGDKIHTAEISYGPKERQYILTPECQMNISDICTDYMKKEEIKFTKKLYRFSFYARFINCYYDKLKIKVDGVEVTPRIDRYQDDENSYIDDTKRLNKFILYSVKDLEYKEHEVVISYERDISYDNNPNRKQEVIIDNILINNEPRVESFGFTANFEDMLIYYDFDLASSFGESSAMINSLKVDGNPIHYFRINDFSRGMEKYICTKEKRDHQVEINFLKKFYRNTDKFDIYLINFFNPQKKKWNITNKFKKKE